MPDLLINRFTKHQYMHGWYRKGIKFCENQFLFKNFWLGTGKKERKCLKNRIEKQIGKIEKAGKYDM